MTIYRDYTRARIGWFFGLTGLQLALLAAAVLPVDWSISRQDWAAVGLSVLGWGLLFGVVAVPVTALMSPRPCSPMATWGCRPFAFGSEMPSMGMAGWTCSAVRRVSIARVRVPLAVAKLSLKTMSG